MQARRRSAGGIRGGSFSMRSVDPGQAPYYLGGIAGGLLILVIIAWSSMIVIEPTKYALQYNRINRVISGNRPFQGGRHIIGFWNSYYEFPATVQNLEFSTRRSANQAPLRSLTTEGVDITLEIAFQYKLQRDDLGETFRKFQFSYGQRYLSFATDIFRRVAGGYTATDYWQKRGEIQQAMFAAINERLATEGAECTDLQMMIIGLNRRFEDQIVNTQVQRQREKTRGHEQVSQITRATTQVLVASFSKNRTITLNTARAESNFLVRSAQATSQQMRLSVESRALNTTRRVLELSYEGLVRYQRSLAYSRMGAAKFFYGVDTVVAVS